MEAPASTVSSIPNEILMTSPGDNLAEILMTSTNTPTEGPLTSTDTPIEILLTSEDVLNTCVVHRDGNKPLYEIVTKTQYNELFTKEYEVTLRSDDGSDLATWESHGLNSLGSLESCITYRGTKSSASQWLSKPEGGGLYGPAKRILRAPNGKEYQWREASRSSKSNKLKILELVDPKKPRRVLVSVEKVYSPLEKRSILGKKKEQLKALTVNPEVAFMLDLIVLSTVIIIHEKHEQDKSHLFGRVKGVVGIILALV